MTKKGSEKQTKTKTTFPAKSSLFPRLSLTVDCTALLHPKWCRWMGRRSCSQSLTVHFCCSFFHVLFPCYCWGPSHRVWFFRSRRDPHGLWSLPENLLLSGLPSVSCEFLQGTCCLGRFSWGAVGKSVLPWSFMGCSRRTCFAWSSPQAAGECLEHILPHLLYRPWCLKGRSCHVFHTPH